MAVTSSVLGSLPGANDKDKKERIPAAVNALNRALAGDASVLAYMTQQSQSSATAVGKEAFRRALAYYSANKPAAPTVTAAPTPQAPTPAAPSGTQQGPKPVPTTGVSVPGAQPAPLGFNPGEVLVDPILQGTGGFSAAPFGWFPGKPAPAGYHVVAAGTRSEHIEPDYPGIAIHGTTPGLITPVRIGRPRVPTAPKVLVTSDAGGVMTGPPDDGVSVVNRSPASSDFGYSASTSTNAIAPVADSADSTATTSTSSKTGLILAGVAFVLLLVVATKGKGGDFRLWE